MITKTLHPGASYYDVYDNGRYVSYDEFKRRGLNIDQIPVSPNQQTPSNTLQATNPPVFPQPTTGVNLPNNQDYNKTLHPGANYYDIYNNQGQHIDLNTFKKLGLNEKQIPVATPDEVKMRRDGIAQNANQKAQDIFNNLPKNSEIDMRRSQELLQDIQDKMDKDKKNIVPPQSLATLFENEKKKLGIDNLETQAANIDSQIEQVKANLLTQADKAGENLVSMTEIGREKGALQREADRQIALLTVQKNAIQRQLANKLNTMRMVMDLTNKDFTNTSNYYQSEYNKEKDLYNIVNNQENKELTADERLKSDARSNLAIIYNALKDGQLSYDDLNTDQKNKIFELETQAGLPIDFLSKLKKAEPKKKIQTVTTRTDSKGNTYFDVLLKGADGALTVKSIFKGKAKSKSEESATKESAAKKIYDEGGGEAGWGKKFTDWYENVYKKTKTEQVVPADVIQDLHDAQVAISQGADRNAVRQRFLEHHPNDGDKFKEYMGY